ncbi:Bax inhibitor-1/YccA family protein [Rheinheimera sp. MM224]|uniref:Bax inhibitor-1/YccA family protein n=1 Tax=Rheinheimera sp. MM224 TaxID=3019969 RepID=UPI0021F9006B|nr:Bax inhibitor-1/YccA family protein [Rheinheimera sp. MM224]CAI3799479.1 Modulator of FtsH protease YccA [Rheinheimera sp. MM224]
MSYNQNTHTGQIGHSVEVNKVLRNTYFLLAMTLTFSAVTAGISMAMNFGFLMGLAFLVAGIVLSIVVMKKAESASALGWIFAFTGCMGASIGPMLNRFAAMANGPELIMQALGLTAVVFFSLSAYVLTSRKDFSFMGNFLFVGLIVAIVAGLANIFLQIPALHLAYNAVIVMIMSGLILFDTSRIINGGETNYIRATVGLYLNIFNLFTSLLQLLGIMGSDD